MKAETTNITLSGREVALAFDKHALARFGRERGTFAGLFDDGQRYFTILLLAWCAGDDQLRSDYSEPCDLAREIEPEGDARIEVILSAAKEAGWLDGIGKMLAQFAKSEAAPEVS